MTRRHAATALLTMLSSAVLGAAPVTRWSRQPKPIRRPTMLRRLRDRRPYLRSRGSRRMHPGDGTAQRSPRHGEWAMIRTADGDSIRAWVVYPERSTKAPVIVVVHEIFGLSSWIRGVADQLAADGFIAIAPDLLTMKNLPDGPDSVLAPLATAAIRTLDPAWVQRQLDAVAQYGMSLPAAEKKYGIVGFCWGGGDFLCSCRSLACSWGVGGLLRRVSNDHGPCVSPCPGAGAVRR